MPRGGAARIVELSAEVGDGVKGYSVLRSAITLGVREPQSDRRAHQGVADRADDAHAFPLVDILDGTRVHQSVV
jgi:hypothetical protein